MSDMDAVLTIVDAAPPPMQVEQQVSVGLGEIQALLMMARYSPRDEKQCIASVLAALENNPAFAEKGIYAIPRAGTTIYGTGIHGARAIASAWKNTLTGALIVDPDSEKGIVRGVFVDGQNGNIRFRDRIVHRTSHRRGKGTVRLSEEEYENQIKIEQSKAERDAILAGIPRYVVDTFFDRAFAIAVKKAEQGDKTPLQRWELAGAELKKYKVPEAAALALLGMEKREQLTHAMVTRLGGYIRAIQAGEATVEGIFGDYMGDPTEAAKPTLPGATVAESPKQSRKKAAPGPAGPGGWKAAPAPESPETEVVEQPLTTEPKPASKPDSSDNEPPSADSGWNW